MDQFSVMPLIFSHVYDGNLPTGHSGTVPSNSTVTNSSGLIVAASSWPRITHDASGTNPRAVFEPACTQYIPNPADLTQWTVGAGTRVDLGQAGALRKIQFSGGGGFNDYIIQTFATTTFQIGDMITLSWAFDPASTAADARIVLRPGNVVQAESAFGASPSLGVTASFTQIGDIVDEVISPTMTLRSVSLQVLQAVSISEARIVVKTTNTGLNCLVYGVNLTNLSIPTSFVTGASRAADTYNSVAVTSRTEGLLAARFKYTGPAGQQDVIKLQNSTTGAFIAIEANETAATVGGRAYDGSAEVADLSAAETGVQSVNMAFDTDDFALSVDGATVQTDTAGDVGALNELVIDQGNGVLELYGLTLGDARVSNVDLAAETPGAWPAGGLDLAPDAFQVFWISSAGLASQTPVALALDQIEPVVTVTSPTLPVVASSGVGSLDLADALIHITSPMLPSVSRAGLQSILLADVLIPIVTPVSPLLSSALPQQRDLMISDVSIFLDAAPRLGLDLTFPRFYAPPARAAAARPAARKKPLLPRP